jgi:hypothetical protein
MVFLSLFIKFNCLLLLIMFNCLPLILLCLVLCHYFLFKYVFIVHYFGHGSSLMCFGCCMFFKCVVVANVTLVVCYSSFMHFGCCSSFKLYNCYSLLKSVCCCCYFLVWLPLAYHFNWLLLKCFGYCSSLKKLFII